MISLLDKYLLGYFICELDICAKHHIKVHITLSTHLVKKSSNQEQDLFLMIAA